MEKTYLDIADKGKDAGSNLLSMKDLQIAKWQRISMGMCLITTLSVGGLVYTATKATFIPYMVNVDSQTGKVQALGALTELNRDATTVEKQYFLSRFVEQIRMVPADTDVLRQNMNRAVTFMTSDSASKFKELYLQDMTKLIQSGSKNRVEVLSVTPIGKGDNAFQVNWEESRANAGGQPIVVSYSGTFTLEHEDVKDKDVLKDNPFGLFIKDFSISEEGEKKATTVAKTSAISAPTSPSSSQ